VLPKKVDLPKLGVRWVEFLANDLVVLNPTLFMDPSLKLANDTGRMRTRQTRALPENPDERPPEPVLQDIESRMFLVNPDPGTWSGRRDLLIREGDRLDAKGQEPNGVPTYRETDTGMQLLIPFRPDPSRGHRPYVRGPDDEIWHMPQHRAVVVAPIGTWDDVVAHGREKIAAYLEANDLEADGAMLCMPFVHAGEIPDEAERKELQLRLEQRVRPRD